MYGISAIRFVFSIMCFSCCLNQLLHFRFHQQSLSVSTSDDCSHLPPVVEQDRDVPDVSIDILSVGSSIRPDHQVAQARSFATHETVRSFVALNENHDTSDPTCATNLTTAQFDKVVEYCSAPVDPEVNFILSEMRRVKLFDPKPNSGWLCAQKRPIDGLYTQLQKYVETGDFPSYLMLIDDDTFLNMEMLVPQLLEHKPWYEEHIVTGCKFNFPYNIKFIFPYGGFGTILTKRSLERLVKPFECTRESKRDPFVRYACWRLSQNHMGELQFHRPGMSVADLMHTFTSQLKFTEADTWNSTGYCFHSDHTLGYFLGFYHISAREFPDFAGDKLRQRFGYEYLPGGSDGDCQSNHPQRCTNTSRSCHYMEPKHMDGVFFLQ